MILDRIRELNIVGPLPHNFGPTDAQIRRLRELGMERDAVWSLSIPQADRAIRKMERKARKA